MTRFHCSLSFAAAFLVCSAPALADGRKDAKKEVAFGLDVARQGLWLEARFRFEKAAALDPDSASAFNNLGVSLEQQGDFEKARAAYSRALLLEPNNLSIQQNYDLFREADEKRNRKLKKKNEARPTPTPTPEPAAPVGETEARR